MPHESDTLDLDCVSEIEKNVLKIVMSDVTILLHYLCQSCPFYLCDLST